MAFDEEDSSFRRNIMFGGQVDGYAEGEEPLKFYHQRGEYRKYEPEEFRDLATGKTMPRRGLLRVLVSSRGNRFMLFVMVLTFALVLAVRIFGGKTNEGTADGVFCDLSAFSMEDTVYAGVKIRTSAVERSRRGKRAEPVSKQLHFIFHALNSDGIEAFSSEADFLFEGDAPDGKDRIIRASFADYDIVRIKCDVSSSGAPDSVTLSCGVELR